MSAPSAESAPGPRKTRRWLLRILCTLSCTALLFEATLRTLVYTDLELGRQLRVPQYYADRWSDPFYFQLAQRWTHEPGELPEQVADPRLGWVNEGMNKDGFADPFEKNLLGRRPVLLFGDSFIRCMTDQQNCFEGWMSRSPYVKTHAIFNYGVRAYGLDQIAMLARLALEHWRDRNALVAIGIFMEDDLDRAFLDYRGWPKPRFSLDEQGQLIEPGPVPTPAEYDRKHPLWAHSLAWGWLIHE